MAKFVALSMSKTGGGNFGIGDSEHEAIKECRKAGGRKGAQLIVKRMPEYAYDVTVDRYGGINWRVPESHWNEPTEFPAEVFKGKL